MTEHSPTPAAINSRAEPWFRNLLHQVPANLQLYMIIDGAHDERIVQALYTTANLHCCLYTEDAIEPELEAVAPHLVKLRHWDDFAEVCLREGARRHWFILFASAAEHLMQLRQHFKHFAVVTTAEGKDFLFRYYDPRVLPSFIAACTAVERDALFKAVEHFYIPSVQADGSIGLAQWSRQGPPQLLPSPRSEPTDLPGSWAAGHTAHSLQSV